MRFCPKCKYYLFLSASEGASVSMQCKNCGFSEKLDPKSKDEALILETNFRSGSSATGASSGISVNEYTRMDPTLPHVNTIRCPSGACPSNRGEERDVIYIKTDPANLKFQYVCTKCPTQWTN
jgi:DNA-directed RNA polymerase subunit M/transcription elongation factor TFIIS